MIQDTVKDRFEAVRGLSTNDILSALGLEKKRTALDMVLPVAGVFVAGALIGAGAALLLAPKSGKDMRRELKGSAKELTKRIGASADELAEEARHALHRGGDDDNSHRNGELGRQEKKPEANRVSPGIPK